MGETCSRLDCSTVEDCTTTIGKKHYVLWYDCAGQHFNASKAPSPSTVNGALSSTAGSDDQVCQVMVNATEADQCHLSCDKFAISRSTSQKGGQWRRRYILGRELGAGQTAVVFEAYATSEDHEQLPGAEKSGGNGKLGRKVALKRLNHAGSSMFRQEVKALLQCGVHPHILRLLECFHTGEDDVLILEYCEGGDIYELYAANNGHSMPEAFVSQMVRQIITALDHLTRRGIEHRDVKPENLLLYASTSLSSTPNVKLADFGWASITTPGAAPASVPTDGVGSLWYAPPELNPPVEGANMRDQSAPLGRSDMWSVGIITYLLLVGHSPFNLALRITDPAAREAEVLRLAAHGLVNSKARVWDHLSTEARQFISTLIQPNALARMSPEEAFAHKFITKHNAGSTKELMQSPPPAFPSAAEKAEVWKGLDGFQRLCWLSIARAVGEPELLEGSVFKHLIFGQGIGNSAVSYPERLAMELAGTAVPAWFQANSVWADVLRLAFRYLDYDADGMLGDADLTRHVIGEDASKMSTLWLQRWTGTVPSSAKGPSSSITFLEFRMALYSTLGKRQQVEEKRNAPQQSKAPGTAPVPREETATQGLNSVEDSIEEVAVKSRLAAIDQVCEELMESEGFREMTW